MNIVRQLLKFLIEDIIYCSKECEEKHLTKKKNDKNKYKYKKKIGNDISKDELFEVVVERVNILLKRREDFLNKK